MNDLFESLPRIYFKIFLSVAKVGAIASLFTLVIPSMVWADGIYMTNMKTNLTQSSIDLLTDPSRTPGVQPGDVVEYVLQAQVANAPGGPNVYFTTYIPNGVEVLGAWFVTDATGTTIRTPGQGGQANNGWGLRGSKMPFGNPFSGIGNSRQSDLDGDTGIFYSTDARTKLFTADGSNIAKGPTGNPNGTYLTSNGYNVTGTFYKQVDAFNLWDADQVNAFGTGGGLLGGLGTLNSIPTNPTPTSSATIINSSGQGATPFGSGSAVAGQDTGYTLDNTGSIGPWNRIQYSGSKKADISDGPATAEGATNTATLLDASSLGSALSDAAPLPSNTNAVRWSDGLRLLNEKVYVKIRVRINAPAIASNTGALLNFEANGSDNWATFSKDNPWRYFGPTTAQSANLSVKKEIYKVNGSLYSGGTIPAGSTITYRVRYVNLGNLPVNGISFKDTLPTAIATTGCTAAVPTLSGLSNSTTVSSVVSGTAPCPGAGTTVTFGNLPNVTSGSLPALRGGEFTYDLKISPTATNTTVIANNAILSGQDVVSSLTVSAPTTSSATIGPSIDYGDAPTAALSGFASSYPTLVADNGASHIIVSGIQLGASIDAETNGQPTANADGDGNDEDGVQIGGSTLQNQTLTQGANVTLNTTTRGSGKLSAWIDWNRDGDFLDSGEKVATDVSPTNNAIALPISIPSGASLGNTYARFRYSTQTGLATTGAASDGEVEDYRIAIAAKENPNLPPDFCQASSRNLLFILDDSNAVTPTAIQQQRDAVMATLNNFVAKNLTGQAAIVGFDSINRTVITYTDITAANLPIFQTALNTNYGVPGSGINWESGFQAGITLGVNQPDVVFFFTNGITNSGGSPDDEATQLKNAGAHIYAIGLGLTVNDGFKEITDGNNTTVYNGSNLSEADYLDIDSYDILKDQYTNAFLKNLCSADFGDAPDTYSTDNIANNSSSTSDLIGANHAISPKLFLGATVSDADANGFVDGIDNNSGNAIDDDAPTGTGTGNGDDEDNFTLPTLIEGSTSYTIPASNIKATNTTTQAATLHAWIDFNQDGKFDSIEYASAAVNQGTNSGNPAANLTWSGINVGTIGNTYVRLRLTSDSSINNSTPGGAATNGEVEDYQVAIAQASDPKLLLVKRITAINPGQPGEIQFNNFIDDTGTTNDNNSKWPDPDGNPRNDTNTYLRGEINVPGVKPADEVEYTVYFLSSGDVNAKEVKICDVVPDQMTFVKNTYGIELGIGLEFDSTGLPLSPNLKLSNLLNDDQGDFYGAGTTPPTDLCKKVTPADTLVNVNGTNNDNGTVVVKIPNLPKADTPGNPMDSYGFIRFRGKVK